MISYLQKQLEAGNWRFFLRAGLVVWLLSGTHSCWNTYEAVKAGFPWSGAVSSFCSGAAFCGIAMMFWIRLLHTMRERAEGRHNRLRAAFATQAKELIELKSEVRSLRFKYEGPDPEIA